MEGGSVEKHLQVCLPTIQSSNNHHPIQHPSTYPSHRHSLTKIFFMKRQISSYLTALLALFILSACGGDPGTEQTEAAAEEAVDQAAASVQDPLVSMELGSADAIEEWVSLLAMKVNAGGLTSTSPTQVSRGDMTYEVVVRNWEDKVRIIRAASPSWEEIDQGFRYFLRDGEVVSLEELKKLEY